MEKILKSNIKNVLNIDSRILKTTFAVLGITASAKLLFSILEKYGVGNLESKELSNEIVNITSEITSYIEAPEPDETETGYKSMFDRIYKPFKTV